MTKRPAGTKHGKKSYRIRKTVPKMSSAAESGEDYRATVKDMLEDLKKGKVKVGDQDQSGDPENGKNGGENGRKRKSRDEKSEKKSDVEDDERSEKDSEGPTTSSDKPDDQPDETDTGNEDEELDKEVSKIMKDKDDSDDEDIQEVEPEASRGNSGQDSEEVISVSSNSNSNASSEKKSEPEVVELTDDDDDDEDKEESNQDGDPDKDPADTLTGYVDPDFLVPFRFGWKREVVRRLGSDTNVTQYDVYYHPPPDTPYRTREAKRKRRSKADQEKYFADFPSEVLSVVNFNYMRKPLGINNVAYEIMRTSTGPKSSNVDRSEGQVKSGSSKKQKVSYKEVEESAGLLDSSSDEEDWEIEFKEGFDLDTPISLQAQGHLAGMRAEHKKRKKVRDPETCCTPPMAEDMLWSELDEDPMGVYNDLGGRSSPSTPPPLRAVKLTTLETAKKIQEALEQIRKCAEKAEGDGTLQEPILAEDLASHDIAIKKFKNFTRASWHSSRPVGFHNKLKNLPGISFSVQQSHRGGQLVRRPNLLPSSNRIMTGTSNMVRVKLPMKSLNGKRPVVELVMEQNGKYQPIKFSNNMQVTEAIPKVLFEQANAQRKPVYQKATQVPRIGGNRIFLAVNPSNSPFLNGLVKQRLPGASGSSLSQQQRQRPQGSSSAASGSDQVAILVKPHSGGKPVLLNVPRRVAIKVKPGTTLSFSASNDQKYTVIDSKIHPPVGSASSKGGRSGTMSTSSLSGGRKLPLPPGMNRIQGRSNPLSSSLPLNLPTQLTSSVSIRPLNKQSSTGLIRNPARSGGNIPLSARSRLGKGEGQSRPRRVLSTGEVIGQQTTVTPCTPYCPGVTGFPELECNGCKSLFHSKCAGISPNIVSKISATYRCKMCAVKAPPQVIDLD